VGEEGGCDVEIASTDSSKRQQEEIKTTNRIIMNCDIADLVTWSRKVEHARQELEHLLS